MRIRVVAVAAMSVLSSLALSSGAISAPLTVDNLVTTSQLRTADRLNPPKPPPAPAPASPAQVVVNLVNAQRTARGLAPLHIDARLQAAAQAHSEDQARMGRMSHTGSLGSNAGQRITYAGFAWRSYGENVAYGYRTADAVVSAWVASPKHQQNNLSANTHVGVGIAYAANGTPYWTLVFATHR